MMPDIVGTSGQWKVALILIAGGFAVGAAWYFIALFFRSLRSKALWGALLLLAPVAAAIGFVALNFIASGGIVNLFYPLIYSASVAGSYFATKRMLKKIVPKKS